jgi:hypothetical protein
VNGEFVYTKSLEHYNRVVSNGGARILIQVGQD